MTGLRTIPSRLSPRRVRVDWLTATLITITALIHAGAYLLIQSLTRIPTYTPSQTANPLSGALIITAVVLETLVIVAAYRFFKTRSEFWKAVIKTLLKIAVGILVAALLYTAGGIPAFVALASFIALDKVLERYDLDYLLFNLTATAVGIVVLAIAAINLAPAAVIPLLVLALLWDHYAVSITSIMQDLVDFSTTVTLPNFLIIPTQSRISFEAVTDWIQDDGDRPNALALIIGLGDFILPGLLVLSSIVTLDGVRLPALLAFTGICTGTVFLRDAVTDSDGGLPALVWLNTGAVAGYGLGIVLSGIPLLVALGVTA